jgi:hypothetical protein
VSYTNRFEDDVETGKQGITGTERAYSVKGEGDGVFADPESDTPAAGKVIKRKIYHKTGFITDADVIGDYTLIHTFADDTAYADTVATFEGFEDGATYGVPPFTLLQTWEEVDEDSLLLDTYTGAAGAYSLRKLRTLYTGDAIRVRRSSDNTEQDIGFSNDELDTVSLLAFAGAGDAFVKTWYDQSGNANDATQTATGAQPKIVSSGAVIVENGKPAVEFDGSDDALRTEVDMLLRGTFSVATAAGTGCIFGSRTAGSEFLRSATSTSYELRNNVTLSLSTDTTVQSLVYAANDTTSELAVNGATAVTSAGLQTDAFNSLALGRRNTGFYLNGNLQEVVIYETNQSSNRTGIDSNINTFYDIF